MRASSGVSCWRHWELTSPPYHPILVKLYSLAKVLLREGSSWEMQTHLQLQVGREGTLSTFILRDVGEPLSPLLNHKCVLLSNMARGGDFFSKGLPECYPQSDNLQNTLVLNFFGNSGWNRGSFTLQWETGIFFIQRYWMMKISMG